ncbi:hypothetical protein ATANTOWER_030872 [Ataeniobius toweri]|uniref:Uncharacterized protein n=1 Tax=Ataeniobius toweri TaxID=208326 RepID=A0ABU7C7R9_9TELE|nr:hypothetical protein [Ataeniobius toweri]
MFNKPDCKLQTFLQCCSVVPVAQRLNGGRLNQINIICVDHMISAMTYSDLLRLLNGKASLSVNPSSATRRFKVLYMMKTHEHTVQWRNQVKKSWTTDEMF